MALGYWPTGYWPNDVAPSWYTAPDNAGIAAIKTKTDTIQWGDVTDIKDESLGKWVLNPDTNILTLYRQDGTTVLKTFNLGTTGATIPNYISRTPQ